MVPRAAWTQTDIPVTVVSEVVVAGLNIRPVAAAATMVAVVEMVPRTQVTPSCGVLAGVEALMRIQAYPLKAWTTL
jgi:hypothetical protein